VSITLHIVCIECREESIWGEAALGETRWGLSSYPNMGELAEAFIFAHRGHVIGLVEGGTIETSETHGDIASVDSLDALLSMHPGTELDEGDSVAEPSDLLRGLLGTTDG
jgi:hypothetical protein